jgi:hypothetical protein
MVGREARVHVLWRAKLNLGLGLCVHVGELHISMSILRSALIVFLL